MLRLSNDKGEKKWTIGGKQDESDRESEVEEKLPPIRIRKAVLDAASADGEAQQRRSPKRQKSRSASPNGEKDGDESTTKRVSTRVRKPTENSKEFLFEGSGTATNRNKRKRKEAGNGASYEAATSVPDQPPRRLSKRVRQSLPVGDGEEDFVDEAFVPGQGNCYIILTFSDNVALDFEPAASPKKKKKKLSPRVRKRVKAEPKQPGN